MMDLILRYLYLYLKLIIDILDGRHYDVLGIYSHTSANEDNSFQNHIC